MFLRMTSFILESPHFHSHLGAHGKPKRANCAPRLVHCSLSLLPWYNISMILRNTVYTLSG